MNMHVSPIKVRNAEIASAASRSKRAMRESSKIALLVAQIEAARRKVDQHGETRTQAEEAMFTWLRENPAPTIREHERLPANEALISWLSQNNKAAPIPTTADEQAAKAEHTLAMKAWKARRKRANAKLGYPNAEARWDAEIDALFGYLTRLAATPAHTLEDLQTKARIALHYRDTEEELAWSIAADLLGVPHAPEKTENDGE